MTAAGTRVEMAAQLCHAAVPDGAEHFQLLKAEARSVSVEKALPCARMRSANSRVGRLIFVFCGDRDDPMFRRS
jgi:hypothetical protein